METKKTEPTSIVLTPIALDADAYYITAKLTDEQRNRVREAWDSLNSIKPGKVIPLISLPEDFNFQRVPSSVLQDWIVKFTDVLKERGE